MNFSFKEQSRVADGVKKNIYSKGPYNDVKRREVTRKYFNGKGNDYEKGDNRKKTPKCF